MPFVPDTLSSGFVPDIPDSTSTAKPRVVPGSPAPRVNYATVPPAFYGATAGLPYPLSDPTAGPAMALAALDQAPNVIGMIGGMSQERVLPGLGMAGLFGAGGDAMRQLGRRAMGQTAPETPHDALLQMASAGGMQMAAEGTGRVTGGLTKMALGRSPGVAQRFTQSPREMMASALSPANKITEQFGDVAALALKHDVIPGPPLSMEGTQKAKALFDASRQAEDQLAAQSSRKWLNSAVVEQARRKVLTQLGKSMTAEDRAALDAVAQDFGGRRVRGAKPATTSPLVDQYGGGVTTPANPGVEHPVGSSFLLKVKRQNDAAASGLYTKEGRLAPTAAAAASPIVEAFQKAYADVARGHLQSIPGMARQMGETKELLGVKLAVEDAESRTTPMHSGGINPKSLPAHVTPHSMGTAAKYYNDPERAAYFESVSRGAPVFASQLPRVALGAYQAMGGSHQ